ncbi:Polcalcin Cup a 4 [Linum perenne]
MAIKTRNISLDGKREMTLPEFKAWLRRFDVDHDGKISRQELADAVRASGGRFSRWKCRQGLRTADSDGNGYIDANEFNNLVDFAQKHLGVKIIYF